MKYIVILGDGMAGEPVIEKGNKTTLQTAKKPHIDELARRGCNGKLTTVSEKFIPCSTVANLGVLGYDPNLYFKGRGVLEAASMGVSLDSTDLALRCNLICVENGAIKNHSAGHISTEEATELIAALNAAFQSDTIQFYPGVSYRHLLVIKNGSEAVDGTPPHDVPGQPMSTHLVRATASAGEHTAALLNDLIAKSQKLLEVHPVNQKRKALGKDPANCIWPWAPGFKPMMPTYQELYGLKGAVISAVDLIKGIGIYAGMEVLEVRGATGLHDTNYEGKAAAAIQALKTHDFVYVHVEASDEAGHEGDFDLKVKCIEYLDQRIVKYIIDHVSEIEDEVTIAVLPDHATPVALKTHTRTPVPFLIYRPGMVPDSVTAYDEDSAEHGSYGYVEGPAFITLLLQPQTQPVQKTAVSRT